jgi:hypothetical protein
MTDMVNHPPHYTEHPVFTMECHDIARHMTFDAGNALKYLWRCDQKGNRRKDLEKARWYLQHADRVWIGERPDIVDRLIDDFASAEVLDAVHWAATILADGGLTLALHAVDDALAGEEA